MKDEYIKIRISQKDKQTIREDAEKQQMSMSEYIIWLIRKEHKKATD